MTDEVSTGLYKLYEPAKRFGLGGVAGAVGAAVVFPIDLVKTRMQNQRNGTGVYRGSWHCFRSVLKNDGVRGLYSGLQPQLIGIVPEKAIKLVINDSIRDHFGHDRMTLPVEIMAGAAAGTGQVLVTNPLEIVKIRLQVQTEMPTRYHKSPGQIIRELGLRGLYKGSRSCFLRDTPFSAIYFPLYAHLKDYLPSTPMGVLSAGTAAGFVAATVTTPADVIKTRLQVEPRPGQVGYTGIVDCTQKILSKEGPSALFKGVVPRVFRAAPQFGVTLFVYEMLKDQFA